MRKLILIILFIYPSIVEAQTVYRIKNIWKNTYLNIENGNLKCSDILPGWWSAMWTFEPVAPNIYRIKNYWTGTYLNIETTLQCSSVLSGWQSAMWSKESTGNVFGSFKLQNYWQKSYLNVETGEIKCSDILPGWWSAMWIAEPINQVAPKNDGAVKNIQRPSTQLANINVNKVFNILDKGIRTTANKIFIDLTTPGTNLPRINLTPPDKYYVIFFTHASSGFVTNPPAVASNAGHAWVVWGHENPQTKSSEITGYGFWPDRETIDKDAGQTMGNIIIGSTVIPTQLLNLNTPGKFVSAFQKLVGGQPGEVPGKLQEDLFNIPYSETVKQAVFEVDKGTYNQSFSVVDSYKDGKPNYKLLEKDCATFFIDVGKSIGIDMPDRGLLSPSSWTPDQYMDLFFNKLEAPNSLSINNGNGSVVGDYDGQYQTIFGNPSLGNNNTCVVSVNGDATETKYRNNIVTSTQIYYSNGNSWYKEANTATIDMKPFGTAQFPHTTAPTGQKPIIAIPLKVSPVSEYTYSNGNTILGYDPISFNPNWVAMGFSNTNQSYYGPINKDGIPNGTGTLNTYSINTYSNLTSISQTGLFINGKFTGKYTAIDIGIGKLTGPVRSGIDIGTDSTAVRIEFNNGSIYTGSFVNYNVVGDGTLTDKQSSFNYSGEFHDGWIWGRGKLSIAGGYTWYGDWIKGKIKSGVFTLPSGDYFVGVFDSTSNGKPTMNGRFYNSQGKQINPNVNQNSQWFDFNSDTNDDNSDPNTPQLTVPTAILLKLQNKISIKK